ncbi:hypothetical protein [Candidatus Magnetobacterium casense]|uniref:Uncharacterized protein n=1 Tax=Candidatus Magnetobacterium casense TaxID=1455061 RepID=A0ABS6RZ37_9BACT|nr:hypothetical protein [Candidatus Magnetobacterium casensis]MBV6341043.1 hypothetical protein [Candidatus Magnetobacterium casensis]
MKLNNKHFQFFKKECKKNIELLGLKGWRVFYEFSTLSDSFGQCQWKYEGRVAKITLCNDFPKPYENIYDEIKRTAMHECLELLLSPISDMAEDRTWSKADFEKEIHSIIRTLEEILRRKP